MILMYVHILYRFSISRVPTSKERVPVLNLLHNSNVDSNGEGGGYLAGQEVVKGKRSVRCGWSNNNIKTKTKHLKEIRSKFY